uniref:CUB domain-containing protein n=1 Tax=Echinostoma caproni TaxID=27848 RepID=A0A183AJY5_9TREM
LAKEYMHDFEQSGGSGSSVTMNKTQDSRKKSRILSHTLRLGAYVMRTKRLEQIDRTAPGYCIPKSLQCDGIVHCHNARDELPSLRIEPSQIPSHLLRDLVGAHLVPTDLQNVGCVTYRISDRRAQTRQALGSFGRGRRLKNDSSEHTWPQLTGPESTILVVGCIGVIIFVGLVLLCSYHQCFHPQRFRGQSFLLPKSSSRNNSLMPQATTSDYEISKLINRSRNTLHQPGQTEFPPGPTAHIAPIFTRTYKRPSIWTPANQQRVVVRSVTRSTLNSTLESYQSSTIGQLLPNQAKPTLICRSKQPDFGPICLRPAPQQNKLTRSSSMELDHTPYIVSDLEFTEWIDPVHHSARRQHHHGHHQHHCPEEQVRLCNKIKQKCPKQKEFGQIPNKSTSEKLGGKLRA